MIIVRSTSLRKVLDLTQAQVAQRNMIEASNVSVKDWTELLTPAPQVFHYGYVVTVKGTRVA